MRTLPRWYYLTFLWPSTRSAGRLASLIERTAGSGPIVQDEPNHSAAVTSHPRLLHWAQGFVLGPILFLLYAADLQSVIQRHELTPHLYADDA
jgi:hypothetical protein